VNVTVPAKDGPVYLGDIVLTIDANDRVEFSAQRLLDLLANVVDTEVIRTLQANFAGKTSLSPADFAASGITLRYNPQELALELDIASERRARKTVQVAPLNPDQIGSFAQPAGFSSYVNVRSNFDYDHEGRDTGFSSPTLLLDGAARIAGIVGETDAIWQPGTKGVDFQRLGSRLVYDDTKNLMRVSAGDLQPLARGFQSAPDIAGVSFFRSYSVLQPQTIIRPRGDRRFRLDRASTVEVQVNGQIVRRLQLAPGNYDLRDFPFTQGANDIRLSILDDAGRTELLRFNVFLDQSQLASGLSEFGFYAGVLAPLGQRGPIYSDELAFTGFYRRGLSDFLTVGANAQADEHSRLAGVEAVLATGIGTLGLNFSLSHLDNVGAGLGATVTFQRLINRGAGRADSINLSLETRSRDFGSLGTARPDNPFSWEVGGGYSHAFSDFVYGGIDGRYGRGRGEQRDIYNIRGTLGWRVSQQISITTDVRFERDSLGSRVSGLLSVTTRLGRFSSVRADYDTRFDRARLSYNELQGQGVGSYNIAADLERSNFGSGANALVNYFANRAELGFSHFSTFTSGFGSSTGQRTSLRAATSLAFADGAFSLGRPIFDSFALVKGHRSLKAASIIVEPSPFGYTAATGLLGAATQPNLSSYAERTVTIDAPSAPSGLDLGQGSFRLFPPYRSGYRLIVGSAYGVTALGRLLNAEGEPIILISGQATELSNPNREPVVLFTNREGRFGAFGLAPGRWRLKMLDEQSSEYVIEIPKDAEGVVRLGDVRPSGKGE
jgi:outer membrane usher protein